MTIIINDLQTNTELDHNAMAGVRGGMGMVAQVGRVPLGPALSHKPKKPGYPSHIVSKSLTNISDQLNIAVGSFNVMQANSNSVTQH